MAYEYQNFASLGVNLNRQAYGALDISAVFKTEADLTWYMTYGKESSKPAAWSKVEAPYPYEGQIVSLVPDTGVVTVYVLEAEKNERGEIQSYDDGKVKLVKKTLSIADSAVSSVNGLTGAISIIPEPDSIIKVEKDANNIKIGADTSGLVKINSNNIVDGNFKLSSGSVSVGFSGEGINIISNSHSILEVGPTGIISNTNNINIEALGTGEILINGNRGVSIVGGTGEILINGNRGVSIVGGTGEISINGNKLVSIRGREGVSIDATGETSIGGSAGVSINSGTAGVSIGGSAGVSINSGTVGVSIGGSEGGVSINGGSGGVSIGSPSGEVSIISPSYEVLIKCDKNSFKFKRDVYDSPSADNTYYVATEKYVDDKIGNISSNKITSPDGNSYVEVTNENGLKIKNKTFDLTVPQKSGTIAVTSDIPGHASTTEFGTVRLTESVLADDTLIPTAGAVHTAIEQVKTEMAGGVIYKGGIANPAVSGTNVILTGVQTPIRPGYMYSITSGSIAVDKVTYSVGDYIIYKGASEASTTTVPASDLTFINAVGSDVVKLNVKNTGDIDINGDIQAGSIHVNGSGEIDDLRVANRLYIDSNNDNVNLGAGDNNSLIIYGQSEVNIPTTKSGTVALTSDIKTYTAKANSGITLTNTEFSGVNATTTAKGVVQLASDMTTNDNLVPTVGVVKTEIQKLTQGLTGTKQLDEKGGNYTVKDIVSLLNKVAALLGAPVYSA